MRDLQSDVSFLSEVDFLAAVKRLAVKEESCLVHRMRLNKMTQPPGTPIRTFLDHPWAMSPAASTQQDAGKLGVSTLM